MLELFIHLFHPGSFLCSCFLLTPGKSDYLLVTSVILMFALLEGKKGQCFPGLSSLLEIKKSLISFYLVPYFFSMAYFKNIFFILEMDVFEIQLETLS